MTISTLILSISWPQSARTKVIAEGHIHYPEQAVKALEAGAFALVVGGAITRPAEITARFTGAINADKKVKWSVPDETVFWH